MLLAATLRVTVPLLAAWCATGLLRSRQAATRHDVWAAALLSGLALLVLPVLLPSWSPALLPADTFPNQGLSGESGTGGALAGVWMTGAVASLVLLGASIVRLTVWTRSAATLPASHDLWKHATDLSVPGSFDLRVSSKVPVPYVWGILRPAVVVPEGLLTWCRADQRSALVHELAHLDRRDILWRLFGELFRAILWFHPLVWVCLARMREESEAACDARVLADGRPGADYARQLLRLGSGCLVVDRTAPCLGQRRGLRARIERIAMDEGAATDTLAFSPATRRTAGTLWAVATITLAVFSPGANGAEAETDLPLQSSVESGAGVFSRDAPMKRSMVRTVTRERTVTVDRLVTNTVSRIVTRRINGTSGH